MSLGWRTEKALIHWYDTSGWMRERLLRQNVCLHTPKVDPLVLVGSHCKAGYQLDKRSISAISDAYFDTSWRGDISWYLDYDQQ